MCTCGHFEIEKVNEDELVRNHYHICWLVMFSGLVKELWSSEWAPFSYDNYVPQFLVASSLSVMKSLFGSCSVLTCHWLVIYTVSIALGCALLP